MKSKDMKPRYKLTRIGEVRFSEITLENGWNPGDYDIFAVEGRIQIPLHRLQRPDQNGIDRLLVAVGEHDKINVSFVDGRYQLTNGNTKSSELIGSVMGWWTEPNKIAARKGA